MSYNIDTFRTKEELCNANSAWKQCQTAQAQQVVEYQHALEKLHKNEEVIK